MFAHDGLQLPRLQKFFRLRIEVKNHPCAARGRIGKVDLLGFIGALAVRRPRPGFLRSCAARLHDNAVRHHEGRIKAYAELTDQLAGGVRFAPVSFALTLFRRLACSLSLKEGAGAGIGNRAKGGNHLFAAHSDAVVGDFKDSILFADANVYAERSCFAKERWI